MMDRQSHHFAPLVVVQTIRLSRLLAFKCSGPPSKFVSDDIVVHLAHSVGREGDRKGCRQPCTFLFSFPWPILFYLPPASVLNSSLKSFEKKFVYQAKFAWLICLRVIEIVCKLASISVMQVQRFIINFFFVFRINGRKVKKKCGDLIHNFFHPWLLFWRILW